MSESESGDQLNRWSRNESNRRSADQQWIDWWICLFNIALSLVLSICHSCCLFLSAVSLLVFCPNPRSNQLSNPPPISLCLGCLSLLPHATLPLLRISTNFHDLSLCKRFNSCCVTRIVIACYCQQDFIHCWGLRNPSNYGLFSLFQSTHQQLDFEPGQQLSLMATDLSLLCL